MQPNINFLGIFDHLKPNPILTNTTKDLKSKNFNLAYIIVNDLISCVNQDANRIIRDLNTYIKLGWKCNFVGYTQLDEENSASILFGDFDKEQQIPSKVSLIDTKSGFKIISVNYFDKTLTNVTSEFYKDDLETTLQIQNKKPFFARIVDVNEKTYQDLMFYPNGLYVYLLGEIDNKKENKTTDIAIVYNKNNPDKCVFFTKEDTNNYSYYKFSSKENIWKLQNNFGEEEYNKALQQEILANLSNK